MDTHKALSFMLVFFLIVSALGFGSGQQAKTVKKGKIEQPVELTMFMTDAGIKFPSDVDPGKNHIMDIVEKIANVDLKVTKPEYADYKTKFSLLMSSGEITDLVHCYFPEEIIKFGAQGAFLPLNDIIRKSPILSKYFANFKETDSMKASDGNIYGLYGNDSGFSMTCVARIDLLDKYNGGVVPSTVEGWYEVAKKLKAADPDSVPFTGNMGFYKADMFFYAYGAPIHAWIEQFGAKWQVVDGKLVNTFEMPGMKRAIEFYKKLYTEKLLDPSFMTNDYNDYMNRKHERNLLLAQAFEPNLIFDTEIMLKDSPSSKKIWALVVGPVAPGVNPKYAYEAPIVHGFITLSISSKCKNVDAAVRVLEAFVSPEVKAAAAWGIEGIEYNLVDGKKVLNVEASINNRWRQAYGFMYGYWYQEVLDMKVAQMVGSMSDENFKRKFIEQWAKNTEVRAKQASYSLEYDPFRYATFDKQVNARIQESYALSSSIILKAVVGQITMEEYDNMVQEYLEEYKDLSQEYEKYYNAHKK